jgi:hypothetical protein
MYQKFILLFLFTFPGVAAPCGNPSHTHCMGRGQRVGGMHG